MPGPAPFCSLVRAGEGEKTTCMGLDGSAEQLAMTGCGGRASG